MSAPPNQGGHPPDLSHLQENFNEQQAKITALKELVRQSEQGSSSQSDAQEKVKSIAQRLNDLKSKATKSRLEKSSMDLDSSSLLPSGMETPADLSMDYSQHDSSSASHNQEGRRSRSETPGLGSEKIQLLRQQMELNRRKMAERESSKRDIEVMVSQLKARFDDTQQSLHRSAELGRSMGDLSSIGGGGAHSNDRDRIRQLEAKVRILETELSESDSHNPKVKQLETRILDLEETIKEKDSLIQARTQAVTLMTENMSMKGRNTVDLLEDTQQEMVRMQENFVHEEMSLKDEIEELKQKLTEKEGKIANLEEVVDILETTRYDLTVKNAELLNQINDVKDYSAKLEELNLLNQQLQKRIGELEETAVDHHEEKQETVQEKDSSSTNSELEEEILELKKQIEKLNSLADSDLLIKFKELEESFQDQSVRCLELEEKLTEKTVELSVLQANYAVLDEKLQSSGPKSLFSSVTQDEEGGQDGNQEDNSESSSSQSEVLKLKAQLDDANKSQIKTKLKMKQMQKQMDNLKKASDLNKQILNLQEENQTLQQKLSELSQNSPVLDSDAVIVADASDMGKKIEALEMTCHNQTAAINLLEEQKVDLVDDLSETRGELEKLRAQVDAREFSTVKSEISSIELEEQLELHIQDKANLTVQVEDLNEIVSNLKEQVRKLKDETVNLDAENQKLTEKLDKLKEKVSSAESIEILENLTHQERLEMESAGHDESDQPKAAVSSEHVEKLQEESAELSQKIELFTTERMEVLEKMERVKAENAELLTRIEALEDKERQLLTERDELRGKCTNLEESVATVQTESKLLTEKVTMMERLESDSSTPGTPQKTALTKDTLRESLKTLETEVDNYMKCKDKNGKLATSKKLAKQAKNCVTQFRDLIEREDTESGGVKSTSSDEEVERLKAMLIESTNIKVEKDQLDEELKSVRVALLEANHAQEDMRGQISVLLGKLSQKDELLEEHETDTAKLLADIKLLQESVQDNATAEEIQQLKETLEQRDQELSEARKDLEQLKQELDDISEDHSTEQKRREAAFNMEKDTMKELIDEQKKQLIEELVDHERELNEKMKDIQSLEEKLNDVVQELQDARNSKPDEEEVAQRFREEIQFKQETIETLNNQIMDLYKSMDGNTTALLEKEDEIVELKEVIEGNNSQLRAFEEKCTEYEDTIQDMENKLREVEEKHSKAANATDDVKIGLEQRIQELEAIVQELDTKNKEQLEKLKKFAANLKKKVAQCNELEKQIKSRDEAGSVVQQDSSDKDELLQMRERQIQDSEKKIKSLEDVVESLTEELNQHEDEMAQTEGTCKELTRKCHELERQLAVQHEQQQQRQAEPPIEDNRVSELTDKIVQLEQALNETNQHFIDKDETIKELSTTKEELTVKITSLNDSLQIKAKEVEKCKIMIKKKMKEIQELKLQTPVQAVPVPVKPNFAQEEVIQTLRSQVQEFESCRSSLQMCETKLQENALYIESLESENRDMNAKIQKLEEGIATIESRRNSMEQKVSLLGATLQEKSNEFQEHEDVLVQRLSTLSAHDEVIMSQLTAIKQENEDLVETVEEHIKQQQVLQAKITSLEGELQRMSTEVVSNLEQEVQQLSYQLSHESQEKKKYSDEMEKKVQDKDKEIEDLENDMSSQFVKFEEERKAIHEQHEKLHEEIAAQSEELMQLRIANGDYESTQKSLHEEIDRLRSQCDEDNDEVKELRMQVVQDQTEIEHLRAQNLDLSQSHESELDRLRCEIINLQENNQIDLLQADLEKFQRELVDKDQEIASLQAKNNEAWVAVDAKNDLIDRLGTKVHDINEKQLSEFNEFSQSVNAMKFELAEKDHEIANLHGEISRNAQIISELQGQMNQPSVSVPADQGPELEHLRKVLEEKDAEIANYQQRTLQLQMAGGGANDPFAPIAPQEPHINIDLLKHEYDQKILAMEENLQSTLERSRVIEEDLAILSEKYSQTQNSLLEKDSDLQNLSIKFQETQSLCLQRNADVERLQRDLEDLQQQLQREQSMQAVNELVQVAEHHVLSAVPIQEEVMVQRSSSRVQGEIPERTNINHELQGLREELERVQMQLTEKCLELDMALNRIREFEAERAKKDQAKPAAPEKKQVAQVSPQQIPEGNVNIPAFSTAQFFETPSTRGTASFFDQPGAAGENISISSSAPPQQMTSTSTDVTDYDNRVPIEEEMIVPKTAYLCFPDAPGEQTQPDSSSMTPNVDDSWGWNAEEAILEEQHQRINYQAPPVPDQRMQQLEDKIQELELERDRQRNEIHEFQLKSAKMLKKLKEYKVVNENLSRQKSVTDSNDLDQAIMDELREQVKVLEAKLKEDCEKKTKDSTEKDALNSRIVQLTANNSRLTEMKGAQELEIERHLTEIRHLRSELQKLNDWDDDGFGNKEKVVEVRTVEGASTESVKELESKITDLAADNDELQAMLEDEKETSRKLEERLKRFTENQSQSSEDSAKKIQDLEQQLKDSIDLIDKLTKDSQDIKVHLDRLGNDHRDKINENVLLQEQLQDLSKRNSEFTSLLQQNQGSDQSQVNDLEQRLQNLMAEMEYKNSDNNQMKDKLASQMEALEVAEDNLKAKETIIENLTANFKEMEIKFHDLEKKHHESTSNALSLSEGDSSENFRRMYEELKAEKLSMEHELQVLNDQVLASLEMEDKMKATVLDFDLKQIEINELKGTIDQLRANGANAFEINPTSVDQSEEVLQLRAQIDQLNQYWSEAVEKRGNDIAESWKTHLESVQLDYNSRIEALEARVEELLAQIDQLQQRSDVVPNVEQRDIVPPVAILATNEPRESTPTSSSDEVEAMKSALESQELEIVTLKEQLAIRSAEFAALSARLDPYGHRATSNMASVQPKLGKTSGGPGVGHAASGCGSSSMSGPLGSKKRDQSELDLALYMLHQRDMRCEELTHELLSLLEERDTLQLKWSDCMRQLESSRRIDASGTTTSGESTENNTPEKMAGSEGLGGSGEDGSDSTLLDAKLQSIHSENVNRAMALRKERDERLQQMAKLQQDIANIPQEAVSEIVGNYSMAETNQSPSSVLMNWLWGKPGQKPEQ